MRKLIAMTTWTAAGLLGFGCAASDLSASAPVRVTGTLLGSSGSALASAPVTLEREPQSLFSGHLAGVACDPDANYDTFQTSFTNASGGFDFSLDGSETQSGADDALCFRIRNSQGALGAAVAFDVQVDQVLLPALQLDDPGLAEASVGAGLGTSGTLSFTWSEPSPSPSSESLTLFAGDGSTLWMAAVAEQGALVLPAYLAEDATQTAGWEALSNDTAGGIPVVLALTATLAVSPPAVVPASRGASCSSSLGVGGLPTPCPLTDGKFHDALADLTAAPSWVSVDLPSPVQASRVVLRGLSSSGEQLIIEGSLDGTAWTQLATASTDSSTEYLDIAFSGPTNLQHVRLTAIGASQSQANVIQDLAQVSIF